MTSAIMVSVYTALKAALSIAVYRAWPQVPANLPGCAFRLLGWQRMDDGSARSDILVTFRANSPEANDGYAATAITALAAIGFDPIAAEDAVEYETGFFLRHLTFRLLQDVPPPPQPPPPTPEEEFPLAIRVYDSTTSSYFDIPTPISFSFTPARKPAISPAGFSTATNALTVFRAGGFTPGSVTFSAPFVYNDPASLAVRAAFHAGSEIIFRIRYRSASNFRAFGPVTAFQHTPLGLEFTVTLRNELTITV